MDAAGFAARYGPWAVVAGGAQGLGAQYSQQLAAAGLHLLILDHRPDALDATAAAIREQHGVEVRTAVVDLVDPPGSLTALLHAQCDDLDLGLLVANAAWSPVGHFLDVDLDESLDALAINCRSVLVLAHYVGRRLRARGRGGMIIMSSMAAESGTANLAVYSATKAFDLNFAESLWFELRDHGVDVVAVRPGSTRTPGWEASQPPGALDPGSPNPEGVMDPADVVAEALTMLGTTPSFVVGEGNRAGEAYFRSLPRRQVVEIMSGITGVLVPGGPRRPD